MLPPVPPTRTSQHEGDVGAVESGLTGEKRRPERPIIFGQAREQERLLQVAREGELVLDRTKSSTSLIVGSGMVTERLAPGVRTLTLSGDHPAAELFRKVLAELGGIPIPPLVAKTGARPTIIYPLATIHNISFRILLHLIVADEPLDVHVLQRRLPDVGPETVSRVLKRLVRDRVLVRERGERVALAGSLPPSLPAFVLTTAEYLAKDDPRMVVRPDLDRGRPAAFLSANDGAPRLFGTDVRLRNLMALAVHGPMMYRDLRKINGGYTMKSEGRDDAPFGRGAFVREWETEDGRALALDDAHPLVLPLRRLLVRLAETYPIAPHVPAYGRPDPPPAEAWRGDRLALFGSALPTAVLLSMAGRGWTFEKICCEVATGYDRVVVRKTVKRLEDEGLLVGSRPRGPGFGPRLLRIAETFPAREELQALIDAAIQVWPDIGDRVRLAFRGLPNKTKVYFERRGLSDDDITPRTRRPKPKLTKADAGTRRCPGCGRALP